MPEQKLQKGSEEWVKEMLEQLKTYRITEADLADFMHYVFENPTNDLISKLSEAAGIPINEKNTDSDPLNDDIPSTEE